MTKRDLIVKRLLEAKTISIDEASVLLSTKQETLSYTYCINNDDYWHSTIS